MSHDKVELQRILSTTSNGSFHHGSSTTMSGSGSFSSEHVHHHTDADDTPNPVYSSIPESQVAHHQYRANQLQHQTSSSPKDSLPPTTGSLVPQPMAPQPMAPQPMAPQSSSTESTEVINQYDFIPDRHKARVIDSTPKKGVANNSGVVGGGTPGMMQAENVLYAGADEANQLRHKTLTMSNTDTFRRFRGEGSPEVIMEAKEDRGCRGCAVLLWGGCVTALVVIALAGAAVALAILFTGFVDVCSCTTSDAATSLSIQELMDKVEMLETMVAALNRSFTSPTMASTDTSTTSLPATPQNMPTDPASMATPTTESTPQEVSLTLNNVSLYMDCNTTIEQTCEIDPNSAFPEPLCTTLIGHRYLNPGDFIMDISCVRVGSSTEQNGLSFVLAIDEASNAVECSCYVSQLVGSAALTRAPVTCGLRVTRCRALAILSSNATLIQTA